MNEAVSTIQYLFAALGAVLGGLLGGVDGFLYALILFIIIDYITGILVAISKSKLSSAIGFKGIAKKVVIFCLVAVGYIIDSKVILNGGVIRTAVIFFYLSNEGISILENVSLLGLPVPEKLKSVLKQLSEEEKNDK